MNKWVYDSVDDEIRYKIFKVLQADSQMSQRALAEELGISLGKTNYCLKALISKGLIKMKNFSHSNNKLGYVYQLTPKGLEEKAKVTFRFLKRKIEEYETIQNDIEQLRNEVRKIENQATKETI
jgi:EPS-associated MarR family transcriptional regulator